MIVTVQQTAVTIVRERDLHTAEQMLVSLRHTELVVGKLLPWTVLAFLEMGVISAWACGCSSCPCAVRPWCWAWQR